MARGLNQAQIIGHVGFIESQDAKGGKVTRLSVATSEKWKDKATGEDKELTEWHKIVLFGKLAEITATYVKKGAKLFIQGKLRTTKYTDKEGIERFSTDIIAHDLQMLDKKEGGNGTPPVEAYDNIPKPYEATTAEENAAFDDAIPF